MPTTSFVPSKPQQSRLLPDVASHHAQWKLNIKQRVYLSSCADRLLTTNPRARRRWMTALALEIWLYPTVFCHPIYHAPARIGYIAQAVRS